MKQKYVKMPSIREQHVTLIMTATIKPPLNCPDLLRSDPVMRLNDYCEALRYYLSTSSILNQIIFVENSDCDLGPLMDLEKKIKHDKLVEFISFRGGNKYPPEYGKGYGEMLMLNYAIDNSKIIHNNKTIWKATGRLILLNTESLIRKAPHSYDLYCDLHNSFKVLGTLNYFDPRFYSFTLEGYESYLRQDPMALRYAHIEHLFYDIIKKGTMSGKVVPRFKEQPLIVGYSGALNVHYFTYRKQLQRRVQQAARSAMPWMWF